MSETFWIGFGLIGQTIFMGRFLVQWVSSEREKRSVIPIAFWYLSLVGGGMLLTYAIQRRDPVFIFGQCFGVVVYVRNLQLISSQRRRDRLEAADRERQLVLEAGTGCAADSVKILRLPESRNRAA
jgi:lipid-A-disaccharide synthase-like uncharacterized protein